MHTSDLLFARRSPSWGRVFLWADLSDPVQSHRAARCGYYACLALAAFALFLGLLDGTPLAALVDVFFFSLAGLGIHQHSRLAAVSALVMFLAERAAMLSVSPWRLSTLLSFLAAPLLLNALRAAQTPLAPPTSSEHRLDALPPVLWPKVRRAFNFYLVGLILLMLAGFFVRQVGLLQ